MNIKRIYLPIGLLLLSMAGFSQSNLIKASDPNIQYTGRVDQSATNQYTFSYSGISISAKFQGTSISAVIEDFAHLGGLPAEKNYFNVFIDGERVQVLEVNRTDTLYSLATGLTDEVHTIEITKRTEASVGISSFKGFVIEGNELLAPDPKPLYRIEFIGDSWTCGYGNEVSYMNPNATPGFNSENEDNYMAWGAITSRQLGYEYHAVAYSGRGLYRSNTGSTNDQLPTLYNRTHPDRTNFMWDHTKYTPDVIVIHLGTNDFSYEDAWGSQDLAKRLDSADYVGTYITFIEELKRLHGSDTKVICAFGNSINSNTPLNQLTRWRSYLEGVVSHFGDNGDDNVYQFELTTQSAPYGEDWHPTIATHQQMADEITPFIEGIMASVVGIGENKEEAELEVFPNPVKSEAFLNSPKPIESWIIRDTQGNKVAEGKDKNIFLEHLLPGVYYLETEAKTTRVVKID